MDPFYIARRRIRWRAIWQDLFHLEMDLLVDPASPFLGMYLRDTQTCRKDRHRDKDGNFRKVYHRRKLETMHMANSRGMEKLVQLLNLIILCRR